jgi:hypothetical protein
LFENIEIGEVFSFMENFLRDESGEFVAELLSRRVKIEGNIVNGVESLEREALE